MTEIALLILALLNLLVGGWWWWRRAEQTQSQALTAALVQWGAACEPRLLESLHRAAAEAANTSARETERALRTALEAQARETRVELAQSMALMQQALLSQSGDIARTQNEQLDNFRTQLATAQQVLTQGLQSMTSALASQAQVARDALDAALKRFSDAQQEQLRAIAEGHERRLADIRLTVETKLTILQEGNERRLEQMRLTVDEKLHATLETRLGQSFKQVAERLEQVHQGLGEMQGLARDVGSLNRVLLNVKSRGAFGEVQLAVLLEQVFSPDQYAVNVETVPGTGARVEFAMKLPGRCDDGPPLWLPIDAKFPREDYERLLDAQERADPIAAEAAAKALEKRLLTEARAIREKYVSPPHTTDFAILFVPIEGLYAEALRRPGLVEALHRDLRISLCGPTTLHAILTSLQMGFRTVVLEKRSTEVWEVLSAVKTEFGKFADVLAKTKKKLDEARNNIDMAATRTRAMKRQLSGVEAMSEDRVETMLGVGLGDTACEDEEAAPEG